MKLVVTIPAFNEEKTIGKVIAEIPKKIKGIDKVEVIVIDDGSIDGTAKEAVDAGATVVRNGINCGLAYSFSRGLDTSLAAGADIIVNTDADFQYNQAQIPLLISPILAGDSEIVLGSRFGGPIEHMPFQKKVGNILVSFLMRVLTGLSLTDTQTGFRAFSREAALRLTVFSDYTYTQETILVAHEKKIPISEVQVEFRKREGKSRLISNIFVYAKKVGFTIIETYINYKPFKIFFSAGFMLLALGVLVGTRVLGHYLKTGGVSPYLPSAVLSALLLIFGFQVLVTGIIAELIKRGRKVQEEALYHLRKAHYAK